MDAFSIATGAAGLASLGITLCDGVISYCRSYQSRGNDLLQLSQEAESLQKFLRQLEERQQGPTATPETLRSALQDSLDACKLCMQGFEALHAKQSQHSQSPSLKNQGKSVVKGLQYPFQKAIGTGLAAQLEISGLGPTITQMFDQRMAMHEESLKNQLTELEERMVNSMPSGKVILPAQDAKLGHTSSSQDSVGLDTFYLPSKSPEKRQDAVVPSICDLTQATDGENALSMTGERLLDLKCHCTRNHLEAHSRTCFYSLKSRKKRIIVGQARLFNFLLQCKITVQYSRHAFYRDLGISTNFTLRATRTGSIAFGIIMGLQRNISWEKPKDLTKILRNCLISLRQSFIDGHAWPTDISNAGINLLHWACLGARIYSTAQTAATWCQFLLDLIGLGVPINDGPRSRAFVIARELIKHGAELPEDSKLPLVGLGGIDCLPLHRRAMIGLPIPLSYGDLSRAILQESEADVRRLLSTTKSVVLERARGGESPLHLSVPWLRGINLLLELGGDAIQDDIDAEDVKGGTPLDYALHLGLYESAKLLLNANAWIDVERAYDIEKNRRSDVKHSDGIVSFLCQLLASRRKELSSIALEWMTNEEATTFNLRRHHVLQEEAFDVAHALQKRHIDIPDYFQNIHPGSIYHYQWMNADLAKALFRAGFDHTNVCLLGFSPLMTANLSKLAQRRGPSAVLELVDWFVNHGANLGDLIPDSACNRQPSSKFKAHGFRLIHRVSYVIGYIVCNPQTWLDDKVCFQQGLQMLNHPVRDSCKCFCVRDGCSPASLFARGMWEQEKLWRSLKNPESHTIGGFRGGVQYFLSFGIARETTSSIVSEIIRVSTFNRLGMKHTCCRYTHRCYGHDGYYSFSGQEYWHVAHEIMDGEFQLVHVPEDDEIVEIQDEDKHLAARLDTLVEEFEAKFEELGQSLVDFFYGYWWEKMDEIENEADELSQEDVEAIQDTGVILEVREEAAGL
ncbi:hypothetical protein EDB80DRAFT_782491 [Ilyonectria destructans]|nr:hypothetical protein EDB80DRAFT_782491 [Ilyonectria destructans]